MLTSVTMIPDLKLGIVVLTNTENGGGPLSAPLINLFLINTWIK
ncbi:MAG: hypothetical protein WDO19_27625 [Bacteroidota bacterium]